MKDCWHIPLSSSGNKANLWLRSSLRLGGRGLSRLTLLRFRSRLLFRFAFRRTLPFSFRPLLPEFLVLLNLFHEELANVGRFDAFFLRCCQLLALAVILLFLQLAQVLRIELFLLDFGQVLGPTRLSVFQPTLLDLERRSKVLDLPADLAQLLHPFILLRLLDIPLMLLLQLHVQALSPHLGKQLLVAGKLVLHLLVLKRCGVLLVLELVLVLGYLLPELGQLLVELVHLVVYPVLRLLDVYGAEESLLLLVIRHTLLLVQILISFQKLLDFYQLRYLDLVLRQVDFLDLVVLLQIYQHLGREWSLQHVVAQVESDQFIVVTEQVCKLGKAIRDHVLGQIQVLQSRFGVHCSAGIYVEGVGQVRCSCFRKLVIAEADVKQAGVVADASG